MGRGVRRGEGWKGAKGETARKGKGLDEGEEI